MKEITIRYGELSKMCRLCLTGDVNLTDMFSHSSKLAGQIVDVVIKCASVRITRDDKLPNFICKQCFNELEIVQRFQNKAMQSERILHNYLQRLGPGSSDEYEEPLKHSDETKDICIKQENNDGDSNHSWEETKSIKTMPTSNKENSHFSTNVVVKCEYPEALTETHLLAETHFEETFENLSPKSIKQETVDYSAETVPSTADSKKNRSKNKSLKSKHSRRNSLHCEICNKYFTQSAHLKTHKRLHTGEKPYQCEVCFKRFRRDDNLKRHTLLHTGEKPYTCDVCLKCFRMVSNLNRHKLQHTYDKPIQCEVCNKSFATIETLNKHKFLHTGQKPYKCDECGKCFSIHNTLKRHKLVHTGEKPYLCDICCKRFSLASNLIRHKLQHTDDKPYQCDICGKCFKQSNHLKTHKRVHKP